MATYHWYMTSVDSAGTALADSVQITVWIGSAEPPNPADYDLIITSDKNGDGLLSPKEWANYTGGGQGLNGGSVTKLFDGAPGGSGTLYSSVAFSAGDTRLTDNLSNNFADVDPDNLEVVCFTPGTMLAVPGGEAAVETLRPGDLVMTLDAGPQPLIWTARSDLDDATLDLRPDLRPLRLLRDALGPGQPRRAIDFSPQHRVLVAEGLAPMRQLWKAGFAGVRRRGQGVGAVSYIHLALADHQILLAEGAPVESFWPGPQALKALSPLSRASLLAALRAGPGPMRPARPFLSPQDLQERLLQPA